MGPHCELAVACLKSLEGSSHAQAHVSYPLSSPLASRLQRRLWSSEPVGPADDGGCESAADTQPDPSVWFWVGTRTIPKLGDFLPKWQGVLVNHNVLNSSLVSLMWEREENLRSNWGSTHQFVTETWNYGFSRLLVYSCICFPTHLPHLFSFPASFLHTSSPFKPDYVPLFLLTLL